MNVRRMSRQTIVVFVKELKDALRDKRALSSILLTILIGPIITGFLMNRLAEKQRAAEEVRIPIVGAEHAPALVEWLRQQSGVEIVSPPANPEQAVRDEVEYIVAIIPPEFAERFRASKPASIRLVTDSSRDDALSQIDRVRRLFQQYSAEIGSLRLVGRGVSPAVATPIRVEDVEVSTAQQRAARILSVIPLMMLLAAFTGAMQIATDSTAGERERGSLEALLVNPAPRVAIALGKCLAATVAAMVTVGLTAGLCASLLRFIPLQEMGLRFRFGTPHLAAMMLALLPLCCFTAALQASIATLARSFKEAQSYMGILMIVPMLVGLAGVVYPINDNQPWVYAVPMLGQYTLLTSIIGGRSPEAIAFVVAAGIAVLFAGVFVRITVSLLHSERVIFGR